MIPCRACSAPVAESARFCPSCGAPFDVADTPTGTAPQPAPASRGGVLRTAPPTGVARATSGVAGAARFEPGTVLADRYRIVGLLGKGGMGEVYRADDLTLGQAVALKFLPEALRDDAGRRERFYGEVRTARQISHPAVCRVYDVGEIAGQPYLSMEFVDGEDLASLLRRIGRLPGDKALDIARQICAGLAAAHDKGVLHRDLKPENVMLDGRGKARITDFGLAGLAEAIAGDEIRSGTPNYMSPEQLEGREVTKRSDIYALGLVLYELFTGRRAFEGRGHAELLRKHVAEAPPSPSSLVEDIDPGVERVILCCLEKEPRRRPASALAVAAALPGGDPLAAALAAGETPSPELVAAAGAGEGLRPGTAWACLAVVAVCLVVMPVLARRLHVLASVPPMKAPEVLEERARELIRGLGYEEAPADQAIGLAVDGEYLRWVSQKDANPGRWDGLASGEPPVLWFWYRQGIRPLVSTALSGKVFWTNPPLVHSGMTGVRLDPQGRLLAFYTIPPQVEAEHSTPREPDWKPLFEAARLDPTRFESVAPRWTPPFYCDARAAWEGVWPSRPEIPIRLEGASYRGKPVAFSIVSPWTRPERMEPFHRTQGERLRLTLLLSILALLLLAGGWLARHHLRSGRGDRRGAFRVAAFAFVTGLLAWAIGADHVSDLELEFGLVVDGLGFVLVVPFVLWVFYLALEPYARRIWPETLISWARLLGGGLGDARVGRDALVGVTWGALLAVLIALSFAFARWLGPSAPAPIVGDALDMLLGLRHALAFALRLPTSSILFAMVSMLILVFARVALKRVWLAALVFVAVQTVPRVLAPGEPLWMSLPLNLVIVVGFMLLILRYGLLAAIIGAYVVDLLLDSPILGQLTGWAAIGTVFPAGVMLALTGYSFRAATKPSAASSVRY